MNAEPQNSRRVAGITGASSGIGRALAEQFAKNGFDLVIAAEGDTIDTAAEELRALGCNVYPVQADLTDETGVERLAAALRQYGPPYAVAINAGIGSSGLFAQTDLRQELRLVDLNCRSVVHLAKRVVEMMQGREGRILITSSIASLAPGPYEAVYSASKAFDYSFALALRHELQDTGISVTALMPGPTETNFFTRAHAEDTKLGQEPKDDPELVAKYGYEALMSGKDHVVAGSMKTKMKAAIMGSLPDNAAAAMHARESKPGSAKTPGR